MARLSMHRSESPCGQPDSDRNVNLARLNHWVQNNPDAKQRTPPETMCRGSPPRGDTIRRFALAARVGRPVGSQRMTRSGSVASCCERFVVSDKVQRTSKKRLTFFIFYFLKRRWIGSDRDFGGSPSSGASRHLLPAVRGEESRSAVLGSFTLFGEKGVDVVLDSFSLLAGRRWREAPDEGQGRSTAHAILRCLALTYCFLRRGWQQR
jgi:hypothetical protein